MNGHARLTTRVLSAMPVRLCARMTGEENWRQGVLRLSSQQYLRHLTVAQSAWRMIEAEERVGGRIGKRFHF